MVLSRCIPTPSKWRGVLACLVAQRRANARPPPARPPARPPACPADVCPPELPASLSIEPPASSSGGGGSDAKEWCSSVDPKLNTSDSEAASESLVASSKSRVQTAALRAEGGGHPGMARGGGDGRGEAGGGGQLPAGGQPPGSGPA